MTSLYSPDITTRIIDPQFDRENFRTEWRLPSNTVYLSNMRLIDMGIDTDNGGGQVPYNPLVGAFCIQSIQLFDGNQLLDQLQEASIYRAFQNFNNNNDSNQSVENWLNRNTWSFQYNDVTEWDGTAPKNNDKTIYSPWSDILKTNTEYNKSWLSLKQLLPFLGSSLYVPSNVFKNLRLVVQWKTAEQLKDLLGVRTGDLSTFTGSALVVDELNNDDQRQAVQKNYQGVVFRAIESDAVHCPAIAPPASGSKTAAQPNRFLINGFNNKQVEKMLIVQTPQDSTTWVSGTDTEGVGNQGSVAQQSSTFQVRVNGANLLPRSGWTRKNQRLAALTDCYGDCTLPPTCNFVYVPGMTSVIDPAQAVNKSRGQVDYTAMDVKQNVNEMVLEYNRVGVNGNPVLNQAIRLNLFGQVNKSIRVDNGRYTVSYL